MFSLFLQYFGLFCLIGIVIAFILIAKENKKQLPSNDEKMELIELGLISENEQDKKVLRARTMTLRTYKAFIQELSNLKNDKLNANIENVASDLVDVDI